jgi:hypothetical protein
VDSPAGMDGDRVGRDRRCRDSPLLSAHHGPSCSGSSTLFINETGNPVNRAGLIRLREGEMLGEILQPDHHGT